MKPNASARHRDAVVIGGGPAGLTAALYLARMNRKVSVVDAGQSRTRWIGTSHNYPTYRNGIAGDEIVRALREQLDDVGAEFIEGTVSELQARGSAFHVAGDAGALDAFGVILATGICDVIPPIPGIEDAIRRAVAGLCIVCHGYESRGKSVAVLTDRPEGLKDAAVLRRFARQVCVIDISGAGLPPAPDGVPVHRATLDAIRLEGDGVLLDRDGAPTRFDQVYLALGSRPNAALAATAGASLSDDGSVKVDAYQETSVPNLFAVGDVAKGLDQIVVGQGHAAIAACHLNARLGD